MWWRTRATCHNMAKFSRSRQYIIFITIFKEFFDTFDLTPLESTSPDLHPDLLFSWPYQDFNGMGETLTLGYPVMRNRSLEGFLAIDSTHLTRKCS